MDVVLYLARNLFIHLNSSRVAWVLKYRGGFSPYRKRLEEQLIKVRPASEKKLRRLGQERANTVKAHFPNQRRIMEERIEILQAKLAGLSSE